MGIDVEIYFKCKDTSKWNRKDTVLGGIGRVEEDRHPEATHMISSLERFYGKGYERGPWPQIASVLMDLLAHPNVEKVWYGGDCSEPEQLPELDVDYLVELTKHYIEHQHEPYLVGNFRE